MEITQVKIFPVHEDKLKAFVSIVLDHCFMINDIKVIQGRDGLFLSMPSRRKKSGEFKDVAHPLNNDTRRLLEERVLGEYWDAVDDPTPRRPDRADDPVEGSASHDAGESNAGARNDRARDANERDANARNFGAREATAGDGGGAPAIEVAPTAASEITPADDANGAERTLEEVEEMHLRDSFWTVT